MKLECAVKERPDRIWVTRVRNGKVELDILVDVISKDMVVMVEDVSPENADIFLKSMAEKLQIVPTLNDLHRKFTSGMNKKRTQVGQHFMTVNARHESEYIPPHSEGTSFSDIQMAAFYCFENTTDGGETILFNVDAESSKWSSLREVVMRVEIDPISLSSLEVIEAIKYYGITFPRDALKPEDQILRQRAPKIEGFKIYDVLTKPIKSYSRILNCETYVYWDTIACIDLDSADQFLEIILKENLIKQPIGVLDLHLLDNARNRRIWRSGVQFPEIFRGKLTRKLKSGDLLIFNNMTWAHSATNWTPNVGNRRVVASFA